MSLNDFTENITSQYSIQQSNSVINLFVNTRWHVNTWNGLNLSLCCDMCSYQVQWKSTQFRNIIQAEWGICSGKIMTSSRTTLWKLIHMLTWFFIPGIVAVSYFLSFFYLISDAWTVQSVWTCADRCDPMIQLAIKNRLISIYDSVLIPLYLVCSFSIFMKRN